MYSGRIPNCSTVEEVQAALVQFADKLPKDVEIIACKKFSNLTISASATVYIYHKLGRAIKGWTLCDIDFDGSVYKVSSDTTSLVLATGSVAGGNISVLVF